MEGEVEGLVAAQRLDGAVSLLLSLWRSKKEGRERRGVMGQATDRTKE